MKANKLSVRIIKLLTCVILFSALIGCTMGDEQTTVFSQQDTTASYSDDITESQIGTPADATVSAEKPTQASTKKQTTKANKENSRESKTSTTAKHISTAKATTSTATVQSVTSTKASTVKDTAVTAESASAFTSATNQTVTEKPTTVKATTAAATTTTTTTQTALTEITCTISIECAEILDNMDSLKAGHEGYIPSNGVILNTYSVTTRTPATVYDLLKTACSENDIKLTEQKTLYGTYIAGINNIDEKDCGAQSGWTYTVNGKYPSKSCDKYKLSNGDTVVFKYTCS